MQDLQLLVTSDFLSAMKNKFLYLIVVVVRFATSDDEVELTEEDYGKTWMYFPNGDGIPEIAYLTMPPQGRGTWEDGVDFVFYTREIAREKPKVFTFGGREKRNILEKIGAHFDPSLDTKVIVHGWKSSPNSDTVQAIKDEYLKNRPCNIFAVDWANRASNIYYFGPATDTRTIGRVIANMLDYLIAEKSADPARIHLIGHSLGAHTVGFAGSYMKRGRVARITGLDPALPGFEHLAGPEGRLDPTDGKFVDVIHSCAGVLGYMAPLGHVDFYPNSGKSPQPGCEGVMQMLQACSHGRSHRFFAESINSEQHFYAYPCESWNLFTDKQCHHKEPVLMGDKVPFTTRGIFYLRTTNKAPFATGKL